MELKTKAFFWRQKHGVLEANILSVGDEHVETLICFTLHLIEEDAIVFSAGLNSLQVGQLGK